MDDPHAKAPQQQAQLAFLYSRGKDVVMHHDAGNSTAEHEGNMQHIIKASTW